MELENQEHDAFTFSLKMIAQLALQININIIYEFLLDRVMSPMKMQCFHFKQISNISNKNLKYFQSAH